MEKSNDNKVSTLKKHFIATRVNARVNRAVKMVARGLGISISEYLRKLIIQDLDSRKMFEGELRKSVNESKTITQVHPRRLEDSIRELIRKADGDEEERSGSLIGRG